MSGTIIGGIIGAVIGFFVGGPSGAAWGWMIGSAAGGLLFPPELEGPRLSDLRPQGSEYGRPIPIIYGTVGLQGNVIWQSELVESSSESGGKGGGASVTSYSYAGNFAVLVCEGEVDGFGKVWAGPEKRLIWDGTNLEGGGEIRFYTGTEDQLPDPLIESYEGVGNVPAYKGYAYVVLENFPLANDGNRIPFLTIEVGKVSGSETLALGTVWSNARPFINLTTNTVTWPYVGSTCGAMQRTLASDPTITDPLVRNVPFDSGFLRSSFYDKDRNVGVYINSGFVCYVVNFNTGSVQTNPPGLAVSGYLAASGIYHNGLYVFTMYGTGLINDRQAVMTIDPDTLAQIDVFYDDGGEPFFWDVELFHRQNSDNYILAWSKVDGTIRKIPINTAGWTTTAIDIGASAVYPYTNNTAAQDPYTNYIWTAYWDGTNVNYVITDPQTETTVAEGAVAASAWEMATFVFTPTRVILCMEKWLATDYFVLWNSDGSSPTTIEGIYHGTGTISVGWYNPLKDEVWFVRDYHWANTGGGDTSTEWNLSGVALWGTPVGFGYNMDSPGSSMTVSGETLSNVVADLCQRAGMSASDYDVSALTDTVDGYAIAQQTTVRGAIQALQPAYYFDAVESGGDLKFVKRGGAIAVTIPDSDLGASESGKDPEIDLIETHRQMEDELPRLLSITYINRNLDYENMTKEARRLVGSSQNEARLDLPLVMTDTKAQGVADTNLHHQWVRRRSYRFTLGRKYSYLEPTDLVSVRGQSMLLTKITQSDGVLKCEGFYDDFNYVPNVVVTESPTTGKIVFIPSPTQVELMDVNMLRDDDDDPGFYAAACPLDDTGWEGAVLYVSTDGGANYTACGTFTAAATIGYTSDVLANFTHGGNIVDEVSSVTVVMTNGTLSSTDNAGLLAGTNAAVIGDEIVFFRTATLTAEDTYKLTGLLRGRRGSEYAMSTHAVSDRFVLLNSDNVIRVSQVTADIGVSKLYKAVSVGLALGDTDAESFTNNAHALECYAPVQLGGGRNAAGDLTMTWVRRGRISGEWRDNVDVPLGEVSEAYEVEIYSNSGYGTLKRTITGLASPTTTYSAADQTTDFGAPQATVYFKVFQMSAIVGRGYEARGSA